MLTQDDIQTLKELFGTKQELQETIDKLVEFFNIATSSLKSELRTEMRDMSKDLKEDNLMFKDQIVYEIVKLKEDFTISSAFQDKLEEQAERIEKMEKKQK